MSFNLIQRQVIVLTGGPCGGKSTLLEELVHDPLFKGNIVTLPEIMFSAVYTRISPKEKLFQKLMVNLQTGTESALNEALDEEDGRAILCHRGSLDPLAYWLKNGWSNSEFYEYTYSTLEEHYKRYTAVIHLVTAADGAEAFYKRWPDDPRSETKEEAIAIDNCLKEIWSGHPRYFYIDNINRNWSEKSWEAKIIISEILKL